MKTATDIVTDPEIFLCQEDLELVGKGIADAVWYGIHRSRARGPGVEFEAHREYQPGDDLRRFNWALYGRQRKLYTKESRQETRRPVYLFLDSSGSMSVAHGAWSKHDYAKRVVAALSFLFLRQGDSPGLGVLRNESLKIFLPPRSGHAQFLGICAELARSEAMGESDFSAALNACHVQCQKKGFIILLSDFFDPEDRLFSELAGFVGQGHEVLAMQILDPYEEKIPNSGDYDFTDTETGDRFRTSAEPLFEVHAQKVADWRAHLKREAQALGIKWQSVTTDTSLIQAVREWLI